MLRTGKSYLESLTSSSLHILYGGQRVHPLSLEKLRREAVVIADYYQHHHRDPKTVVHSDFGSHSATLLISSGREDLLKKSECYYSLAKNYLGIVGRPPDYINCVLSSWAGCRDLFGPYSKNVFNFYKRMVEKDLFVTHSTSELKGGSRSGIRVIAEKENGVVISGARAMATAAAISDEIFIAPTRINDADVDKAIVCAIPSDTEGLKLICRSNFDGGSELSDFYDESDALVVLENVLVPWERVFVYKDLDLYKRIVKETGTSLAASLQTNARAIAKMELIVEMLVKWKNIYPNYQPNNFNHTCGSALRDLQILKALQQQAIDQCQTVHTCAQPNGELIEAAKVFFMERYQKIVAALREDMGADLFYLFEPDQIDVPTATELCAQWGISQETFVARQKVSRVLFDLLISTFGIRHELYEQFFAGNPKNAVANYWNNYFKKYASDHAFKKFDEVQALFQTTPLFEKWHGNQPAHRKSDYHRSAELTPSPEHDLSWEQ